MTVTAASTSSESPAVKQSDSPSPPSSTLPGWSKAQTIGWGVGGSCGLLLALVLVGHLVDSINNGTSCLDCSNCTDCSDCFGWFCGRRKVKFVRLLPSIPLLICSIPLLIACAVLIIIVGGTWKFVTCGGWKKKPKQQKSPEAGVQGETTAVELDATNEVIGELSAPETTPYHSHPPPMVPGARELEGSSTPSHQ